MVTADCASLCHDRLMAKTLSDQLERVLAFLRLSGCSQLTESKTFRCVTVFCSLLATRLLTLSETLRFSTAGHPCATNTFSGLKYPTQPPVARVGNTEAGWEAGGWRCSKCKASTVLWEYGFGVWPARVASNVYICWHVLEHIRLISVT